MKSQSAIHPPLKLDKIIGLTSIHNACFVTSIHGDIFYSAGCFIVRYSVEGNRQKGFYKANKTISCISLTEDCKYLAISEKGNTPITTIWNVDRYEKLVTLSGHKYGIGCQAFSPNGRYLVTIGFKFDKQLILWDWRSNNKLSIQKLGNKVNSISFHNSGDFFVTAGDRHLKWWNIIEVLEGEAVSLEGKAASILEEQRNSIFMDVICGYDSCDTSVYCTTSTGILCLFNESKMVEKWVQLESSSSYCMELICKDNNIISSSDDSNTINTCDQLYIGCAKGTIRCFSPLTLQYITTLPLPAPLNDYLISESSSLITKQNESIIFPLYPACYCIRKVPGNIHNPIPKIAAIYADRGLYVWDVTDLQAIFKYRSFIFHRACIWDIRFIEDINTICKPTMPDTPAEEIDGSNNSSSLPKGSFVTCAADNTIKFWNVNPKVQHLSKFKSNHSKELLHSIDLSDSNPKDTLLSNQLVGIASSISATQHLTQESNNIQDIDLIQGIPDTEMPDRIQSKCTPRAIAIHPYGHQLACGDKLGRLRLFDLCNMKQIGVTQAHAAEILTLSYSPVMVSDDHGEHWYVKGDDSSSTQDIHDTSSHINSNEQSVVLLASAGRDRLIHLFDASYISKDTTISNEYIYNPLETLDQHTSSVTTVQFTSDGKRFLSCGGDRTMVFSSVHGPHISKLKSVPTPHGTVNGLAIEASNKFAITSGQDKRLNIWNLMTGKHMRAYKSDNVNAELYKSDIDPSGMYIATCAFDKTISIFDFFSGELISQVSGHSELITGVKFSPDGRSLISIGGDGCIMIWKVADYLVKAMQDRLVELMTNAQRKSTKADEAVRKSQLTNVSNNPLSTVPATTTTATADSTTQSMNVLPPPPPPMSEEKDHQKVLSNDINHSKNRWIQKDNNADGYELFGKKIRPTATPETNRNKFTLELTSTIYISPNNNNNNILPENNLVNALEATDHVVLSGLSDAEEDEDHDSEEENLFKPLQDTATTGSSQYLEGDKDNILDDQQYEDDFEDPSTNEDATTNIIEPKSHSFDPDLEKTQHTIEGLEKSANDLENWLENMIRNENMLEESVSTVINNTNITDDGYKDNSNSNEYNKQSIQEQQHINNIDNDDNDVLNMTSTITSDPNHQNDKKIHHRKVINKLTGEISIKPVTVNLSGSGIILQGTSNNINSENGLDKSLSTSFFENLRKSKDTTVVKTSNKTIVEDNGDDLLPPPPPRSDGAGPFVANSTVLQEKERKQRETAAAVALMRERLRSMGVYQTKEQQINTTNSRAIINVVPDTILTSNAQIELDNNPSSNQTVDENDYTQDGYETASTISEEQQSTKQTNPSHNPNPTILPISSFPISSSSTVPIIVDNNNNNNNLSHSQSQSQQSKENDLNHPEKIMKMSIEIATELKRKSMKHQQIIKELEEMKLRATASYKELSDYRASINQSLLLDTAIHTNYDTNHSEIDNQGDNTNPNPGFNPTTPAQILQYDQNNLSEKSKTNKTESELDIYQYQQYSTSSTFLSNSIAEVDKLLQHSNSIISFSNNIINNNPIMMNTSNSSSSYVDNNINDVLERYSDRLIEMISSKLAKNV